MASSNRTRKSLSKEASLVQELADILDARSLMELELETEEIAIRLSRNVTGQTLGQTVLAAAPAASVPAMPTAPAPSTSAPAAAEPAAASAAPDSDFANHPGAVKAPMVGTAYAAPEPDAPDFISEGKTVRKGQTLLIIEAMKVMNPITAPKDGTVSKILFSNAQPVEFDQLLVVID